eukprot:5691236-Amphidinium_carterae.1
MFAPRSGTVTVFNVLFRVVLPLKAIQHNIETASSHQAVHCTVLSSQCTTCSALALHRVWLAVVDTFPSQHCTGALGRACKHIVVSPIQLSVPGLTPKNEKPDASGHEEAQVRGHLVLTMPAGFAIRF